MRIPTLCLLTLAYSSVEGFVPSGRPSPAIATLPSSKSRLAFGVDPSNFGDLSQHVSTLQDAFSSISIADEVVEEVTKDNGWFGFLTLPIESFLQFLHTVLVAAGMNANTWGISIIALTTIIKVATFPLTKTQLESTNKMQAMQPAIKELQAKYQSNPEVMNQKIAEFYQTNEINPLAGCLPSLVQIPIFIGLYRAVLKLAAENQLNEPFLFLPNLEGPTYGADPTSGSDWLFKNWYVENHNGDVKLLTCYLTFYEGSMVYLHSDGMIPPPFSSFQCFWLCPNSFQCS